MLSASLTIRVRYSETDQMGIVYYGNYAQYFEIGRVETLRQIGISYADIENNIGVFMPVMSMEVKYIRPIRYDERITIETQILALPEDVIRFRSYIYNDKKELLNTGMVKLCFLEKETNKRIKTPQIIIDRLKPYFESEKNI